MVPVRYTLASEVLGTRHKKQYLVVGKILGRHALQICYTFGL